jgi:hypothetical protein
MLRALKRLFRRTIVSETSVASVMQEGLETLARALCVLAVERHAKDPGHHRELAAVMWIDVMSDFREVKYTPQTRDYLAALLKIDPKSMPKGPR